MPSKNWFYYLFLVVVMLALGLASPPTAQAASILYVKPDGVTNGNCGTWANACDLQYALTTVAVSGDEIWVAAGEYKPTSGTVRTATFQLKSGVALYGGFAGTETARNQRDWKTNVTTLSGDIGTVGDKSDNSYHVVTGSGTDASAVLDGFTITGGNANADSHPMDEGGGMYNDAGSPTVRNVVFSGNSANQGGGMYNWSSNPTLVNVAFNSNSAEGVEGFGGGIDNALLSSPILVNVTFSGNSASTQGGGMWNWTDCSPTMVNVIFSGNSASVRGGGMYNQDNSNPTLVNVTFSGNSADYGGGIWNERSNPTLTNSILWGNSAPNGTQIYNIDSSIPVISYSLVQGSGGSGASWDSNLGTDGGGNIDADPQFVDADGPDDVVGTLDDDLRLQATSPAIDAGDNSAVPTSVTTDLAGNPRIFNGTVDMGAYEAACILHVRPIASGSGDCSDWDNACTMQTALAKATVGSSCEIWVVAGEYKPTSGTVRTATFQLKSGVALYGGFAGTETSRDQRDWVANPTTLSGDIGTVGDKSDNSYHVVTGSGTDASAVLDGFTITGGNANADSHPMDEGGGMYNNAGSPTVRNVVFSGNSANQGGGMYNWSSNPTLVNVAFNSNSAEGVEGFGGGIDNALLSSPILVNVTFSGNSASTQGGGMWNWTGCSPTMVNVIFSGNSASMRGGGMYNQDNSNPTLVNVTFSSNSADYGGGIWNERSNPTLTNSILWGNSAPNGTQIYNIDSSIPVISYSLVQGSGGSGASWDSNLGTDGGGNIDADPQFVDADGPDDIVGTLDDDLRLQATSPAIDAGDNSALPADTLDLDEDGDTSEPLPVDLGGRLRIFNGIVDMGAYESHTGNHPPTATDDSATTNEDFPVTIINALSNDTDPDGDVLSVRRVTQPSNGTAKRSGTTDIIYTPYLNFYGSDSFTYIAFDGIDESEPATVAVTVNPVNDLPTAVDDVVTTLEDTPVITNVLSNDTDPEKDPISVYSVGQPGHGGTERSGTSIVYTPDANFNGSDSFIYTVSGSPGTTAANVWITVTPVNDAPTDLTLSNASVGENQPLGIDVGTFSTTDVESDDSHTYSLVSNPGNSFQILGDTLRTNAVFDFETRNVYSIRVKTDDGNGGTFEKQFNIGVTNANDAPTDIGLSNNSVAENQPEGTIIGSFSATDPDPGDTHTFALAPGGSGSDDNRFFTITGNTLKTAASFDYEEKTTRSVRVRADDGQGGVFEKSFLIYVRDVADPPPSVTKCSGQDIVLINTRDTQVKISNVTLTQLTATGCTLTGLMQVVVPGGNNITGLTFKGRVNEKNQLLSDGGGDEIQDFDLNVAGLTLKAVDVVIDYYLERPMLRIKRPELVIPEEWGGLRSSIPNPVIIDGSGVKFGTTEIALPEIQTKAGFALSLKGELTPVAGGYEIKAAGDFTIPNIGKKKAPGSKGQECSISVAVTIYAGEDGQPTMLLKTQHTPPTLIAQDTVRLSEITVGLACSVGIPIDNTGFALTGVAGTVSLRPNEEFVQLSVTISSMRKLKGYPLIQADGTTKVTINPAFALDLSVALKVLVFEVANTSATITENSFTARLTITTLIATGEVTINAWTRDQAFHFTGSGRITVGVKKYGWAGPWCLPYPCGLGLCKGWWGIKYPCFTRTCRSCTGLPPLDLRLPSTQCDFGEFTNGAYGIKGYVNYKGISYGYYIDDTGRLTFGDVSRYTLVQSSEVQRFRQMAQAARLNNTALDPAVMDDRFTFPSDHEVLIKTPLSISISDQTLRATDVISRVNLIAQTDVSFVVNADGPLTVTLIAPNGDEITPDNYQTNPNYGVHYEQYTFYELDREPETDDQLPRLRFTSASPHPTLEQIDVKVDGTTIFASVSFTEPREMDYVALNPGSHTVDIVPVGTEQPALTAILDAVSGTDYTVVTLGATSPEAMVLTDENRTPEAFGQARVRFVNGSAGNGPVDVFIGGVEVFDSVAYKGVSSYQPVPAGDHTIEMRNANTGQPLSLPGTVTLEEGSTYTFIAADLPVAGYPVAWLQTLDESYALRIQTEYGVDQAPLGEWQVKLSGNLDETNYIVAVLGPSSNPPILRELTVDATDLNQTQVSWRLKSDFSPTLITVYATPGPITETLVLTDTTGVPTEQVVPLFEGFAVDEVVISDVPHLGGELTTRSVDLSNLGAGDYYLWIRAEDGVNSPVSGYLAPPGMSDGNAVEVARDGYDPLAQLENAAVIHVAITPFPESWIAAIRPSLNEEETEIYVEWDVLDHPDVDSYVLYAGTSPLSATRVISAGGAITEYDEDGQAIGNPVAFANLTNVEPDQTYYLSVEAHDRDTGRTVRSQEISLAVDAGDFSLSTSDTTYEVDPGGEVVIWLRLVIPKPLLDPWVSLSINLENAPLGITAQCDEDVEGCPTLWVDNQEIDVNISVAETVPEGVYVLSFTGYNRKLERTLDVVLQVGKPTAVTLISFTGQGADDHVTLTWETASELDNEGFNIWRSEAADGEYTRLNPNLIPARGNADTGASYEYTDTDVVKGVTYYYKLEDVDIHGASAFHGPMSATPSSIRPIYLPLILK